MAQPDPGDLSSVVGPASRTLADLALTGSTVDRAAAHRADPDWLSRVLADPATSVLAVAAGKAAVQPDGRRLALRAPVPRDIEREAVYLGERDGTAYVAVFTDPAEPTDGALGGTEEAVLRGLRSAGATLEPQDGALFATALALFNWHRTHRFCPRCGGPTNLAMSGWIRVCPNDSSEHYPRTDPAVIMAVVDPADRLLLARSPGFTAEGMSVLAGFVEPGETLEAAVAREVEEEVGVRVGDVTYRGDQPWPFPSSIMIGFRAEAVSTDLRLQESEIAAARWFSRDELVAQTQAGRVHLPSRLSISRRLIEDWFGGPIDAPERLLRR